MKRQDYYTITAISIIFLLTLNIGIPNLYESYLGGRIIYGATNTNNSVDIGNNTCFTKIYDKGINFTCGGNINGLNITSINTLWSETLNIIHPTNLSKKIGIGTNSPVSNSKIEIKDTNTTILAISSGTGNENATIDFLESDILRARIEYAGLDGLIRIWSKYGDGMHDVLISLDTRTNEVIIPNTLNVYGNFTANNYYAGIFYHNNTGTTINFIEDNTYYHLFMTNSTDLNGFTSNNLGFGLNSSLTCHISGVYKASFMGIGSGQNNHIYVSSIFVNDVNKHECEHYHKMSAGGDIITQNGICIITINEGDDVSVRTADLSSSGTGVYYGSNLNLVRIGNV